MARARRSSVHYSLFESAFGTCAIAWTSRGIVRLQLPEGSATATRRRLRQELEDALEQDPPAEIARVIRKVTRHLGGVPARFDTVAIDLQGVGPFARQVYEELRGIDPGSTVTYGELATRAGRPRAARAVGQAMARNPLPVIVPCHRVLASGGKAGGFSAYGGT